MDDLRAALLDCSAEGFAKAMDVSCHSFIRMARLAAPLMKDGGTMFAMSYYGANRVVPNYNVMGPGQGGARSVLPLSRLRARAAAASASTRSRPARSRRARPSGLKDFELLLNEAAKKAPLGELVDIMDVGYDLRLSRHALRAPHHRRHGLCRRRHQHRRLSESGMPTDRLHRRPQRRLVEHQVRALRRRCPTARCCSAARSRASAPRRTSR